MKPDLQVLDEAIALIEREDGWCQGSYCKKDGAGLLSAPADPDLSTLSFCLEGAIGYVNGWLQSWWQGKSAGPDIYKQWVDLIRLVAQHGQPYEWGYIAPRVFNDDKDTSQEDAILALKNARAWLEQE